MASTLKIDLPGKVLLAIDKGRRSSIFKFAPMTAGHLHPHSFISCVGSMEDGVSQQGRCWTSAHCRSIITEKDYVQKLPVIHIYPLQSEEALAIFVWKKTVI